MARETMAGLRLRLEVAERQAALDRDAAGMHWRRAESASERMEIQRRIIVELLAADAELEACTQPGAFRTAAMKRYSRAFQTLRDTRHA